MAISFKLMEVTKATLFTLKLTIEKRNEKSFAINTRENLSIKEKKKSDKIAIQARVIQAKE